MREQCATHALKYFSWRFLPCIETFGKQIPQADVFSARLPVGVIHIRDQALDGAFRPFIITLVRASDRHPDAHGTGTFGCVAPELVAPELVAVLWLVPGGTS